ncbi:MAG: hypothetical protein GY793_11595 [Proteobacteria bacterium]|nr:hypothetical protein [Pseudomonadota bacterium]
MGLRELLWKYFYAKDQVIPIPTPDLISQEIAASIVISVIWFIFCWLILRRLLFLISEKAWHSRLTALIFGFAISIAWLIASLEWLGFYSTKCMTIIIISTVIINLIVLLLAKGR